MWDPHQITEAVSNNSSKERKQKWNCLLIWFSFLFQFPLTPSFVIKQIYNALRSYAELECHEDITKRRRGKITLKWIPPPSPKILDFQASHFSHEAGKVVFAMKINKPKILVLKTTKSICPSPVSRDLDWWRRERVIMYRCFSLLSCQGPKKSCCYAQGSKEIKSSRMSGKGKYWWALEMFLGIHFIYHKSLL